MVTLKREAKTESDRYGGYTTRFNSTMSDFRRSKLNDDVLSYNNIPAPSFDDEEYKAYLWNELQRNEPRNSQAYDDYVDERDFAKRLEYVEDETDYRPMERSVSYTYEERAARVSSGVRAKASLNIKAKLLIAAYVMIVILLTTLIVTNATGIATLSDNIAAAEAAIGQEAALLEGEKSSFINMTDAEIANMAKDYGMIDGNVTGGFDLIPMNATVTYDVSTNWFDQFCDWISNITGG